jgi:hypothetical protein
MTEKLDRWQSLASITERTGLIPKRDQSYAEFLLDGPKKETPK